MELALLVIICYVLYILAIAVLVSAILLTVRSEPNSEGHSSQKPSDEESGSTESTEDKFVHIRMSI